jgi:hypothetical protein
VSDSPGGDAGHRELAARDSSQALTGAQEPWNLHNWPLGAGHQAVEVDGRVDRYDEVPVAIKEAGCGEGADRSDHSVALGAVLGICGKDACQLPLGERVGCSARMKVSTERWWIASSTPRDGESWCQ